MGVLDSFLKTKPPALAGVDIGSSGLRLVELDRNSSGQWELQRYASEALPNGAVAAGGHIERLDDVADALRRIVRNSGTRTKSVVMALPAAAAIAKKVVLPDGLRAADLEEQIMSEATQFVPFPLEEVSLDWHVLGPSSSSAGDMDVLIVGARKERVEEMEALVRAAGLKLVLLDVNSYAAQNALQRLVRAMPRNDDEALVALVQIGASATTLTMLRNGEVVFEREQPFGGVQLTQQIAKLYNMTFEEAESKKLSGQLPDDYAQAVQQPYVEHLAQELQNALQFFYSSTPFNKVDALMLAGGSAALPRLNEVVKHFTGIPSMLVNPFEDMAGAQAQDRKLRRDASAFLTACGLAMRRFSS